jgi:hypothetical protein
MTDARIDRAFAPPADLGAKTCRYISFDRFVWVLENSILFFSSVDRLASATMSVS